MIYPNNWSKRENDIMFFTDIILLYVALTIYLFLRSFIYIYVLDIVDISKLTVIIENNIIRNHVLSDMNNISFL